MRSTARVMPVVLSLVLSLFVMVGCKVHRTPVDGGYPTTTSALEISADPSILATKQDQWSNMTLYGIGLGQPETVLPKIQIVEQINGGWIVMRNGNKYLSGNNNHIDAFSICEKKLLEQLKIQVPDDIARVFGPGGVSIKAGWGNTIHYFNDRHIRVIWNVLEKRVAAVDVWK